MPMFGSPPWLQGNEACEALNCAAGISHCAVPKVGAWACNRGDMDEGSETAASELDMWCTGCAINGGLPAATDGLLVSKGCISEGLAYCGAA
jgi:hypothetical protein